MLKIGLTGNIGSGKSTIAKIFEKLGVPVFYADLAARDLFNNGMVKKNIIKLLGTGILDLSENRDRKKVASIVFDNTDKLNQLNEIIHPQVRADFNKWCDVQSSEYVIMEAAILVESGLYKQLDQNIVVSCPEELRIEG